MAIDTESPAYKEGREKLYEHVQAQHTDHRMYERIPDAQGEYAQGIRAAYEKNLDNAHKEGFGQYADANYVAGAKAGVQQWEGEIKQAERERQTEQEKAFRMNAWA